MEVLGEKKSNPFKLCFRIIEITDNWIATIFISISCLSCLSFLPKAVTSLLLRFEKSAEEFSNFRIVTDFHHSGDICIES